MKSKTISYFLIYSFIFFVSISNASDLNIEQLLAKTQVKQKEIIDIFSETTTKITSNIQHPTSKQAGPQTMIQKGKMWTRGSDKSKIEMLSPSRQITIINGDRMAIINPATGQKTIQDLSGQKGQMFSGQNKEMNLEKAMEYFNLSVRQSGDHYIITGIPKKQNNFLSKMEFYLDVSRWVPTKILMYGAGNKLISQSEIEYEKISDVWVPVKNMSNVNTQMGRMSVEMSFENIKVNQGISDKEFEI